MSGGRQARWGWLPDLARSLGLPVLDGGLLAAAQEAAAVGAPPGRTFESLLEFSFAAQEHREPCLRYTIDVSRWDPEPARRVLEAGLNCAGLTNLEGAWSFLRPPGRGRVLDFIGAQHGPGGMTCKAYLTARAPVPAILSLLPPAHQAAGERVVAAVRSVWPAWRSVRFTGMDCSASEGLRVKLYYPPRSDRGDLPLEELFRFMTSLGLESAAEDLAKVACLWLDRSVGVESTAFIIGVVLGPVPSVKLEIAAAAYCDRTEEALARSSGLAVALGLDPSPLRRGIARLTSYNPFRRAPRVEVVCVEFLPGPKRRLLMYCRL